MTVLFQGAVGEPEWWATRAIRSPVKRGESPLPAAGTPTAVPAMGGAPRSPVARRLHGQVGPSAADKNIGSAAVRPRAAPRRGGRGGPGLQRCDAGGGGRGGERRVADGRTVWAASNLAVRRVTWRRTESSAAGRLARSNRLQAGTAAGQRRHDKQTGGRQTVNEGKSAQQAAAAPLSTPSMERKNSPKEMVMGIHDIPEGR